MKAPIRAAIAVGVLALSAGTALVAQAQPAPAATAPAAAPSIQRMDPALDAIIPKGAVIEKVAGGFQFVEGPLWYKGELWFSDLTGNKLYVLGAQNKLRLVLNHSGGLPNPPAGAFQGSNGLAVGPDGGLLMTQHGARRIVKVGDDMKLTPFIDRYQGKRLNSPNDMVFAKDGSLWITDPPYGLLGQDKDPAKEVKFNAVWRYANGKLTPVITDVPRPNGIAFSPDGKTLYISNSEPDMFINAYDVGPDGKVSKARRFMSFPKPNPIDVPDGMKVDSQGNIWASGPGGIRIINPQGKVLGQLKTSDRAQANLTWGGPDLKTAYIMGAGNVYKLQLAIPGDKPLYSR